MAALRWWARTVAAKAGFGRRLTMAALAQLSGAARRAARAAVERIARQIRAGERASLEAFTTDRTFSSAAAEKSKNDNREQGTGGWPPQSELAIRAQERHVRLPLSPSEREGQAAISCRALGQVSWLSDRPPAPLRRQPSEPPTFPRTLPLEVATDGGPLNPVFRVARLQWRGRARDLPASPLMHPTHTPTRRPASLPRPGKG